MFCSNCGKEVAENAVVCVGCGVALKKSTARSPAVLNKEALFPKIAVSVVSVVTVLLSLCSFICIIIAICLYETPSVSVSNFTTSSPYASFYGGLDFYNIPLLYGLFVVLNTLFIKHFYQQTDSVVIKRCYNVAVLIMLCVLFLLVFITIIKICAINS